MIIIILIKKNDRAGVRTFEIVTLLRDGDGAGQVTRPDYDMSFPCFF